MTTALYLLPVPLGDTPHSRVLPDYNREVILSIRHFVVENVRTARRFLKKVEPSIDIDALTFSELNKHTAPEVVAGYLAPLERGESVGVISEAGCPAVADPGADVVAIAQRKGYKVVPLVGPSSILLSVMASGFNGQSFAFHGYLPIDGSERANAIPQPEAGGRPDSPLPPLDQALYRLEHHMRRRIHPHASHQGMGGKDTGYDKETYDFPPL